MTVQDRIRLFIKHERLSITAFCDSIGVSNAYVSSMTKSISQDKLQTITLKYPILNIEWLLLGDGDMINTIAIVPTDDMNIQKMKWTIEQMKETIIELKKEKDDAIREASKWQTIAETMKNS